MSTESIGLFKAMTAKMSFLDQRQKIISQNVANADTPGYIPHDLVPVDFGAVMSKTLPGRPPVLRPVVTNDMHIGGKNEVDHPKNKKQKTTYEVAPAGNSVILEEQMVNATKTATDYNLMTTLYQKNVGMLRTALDRGQ